MPQAGIPVRARRRDATPWWEELDRELFRFPTTYEVMPAERAVARTANGSVRAVSPAIDERAPAPTRRASAAASAANGRASTADRRVPAANGRTSARVAGPSSRPRPVAAAPAPRAAAPISGSAPTYTREAASAVAPMPGPTTAAPGTDPVADGGRRTVVIRGYGAERNLPVARPTLRRHERPGFRPDRAALWAFILGVVLILVAVASAHGAVLH
jgi:hypothetical protein